MASQELARPLQVYSYNNNNDTDRLLWEVLKRHLKYLIDQRRIEVHNCHDETLAGSDYILERNRSLNKVDLIFPLLSVDFFNDDFCMETTALTEVLYDARNVVLVPIRFRPVYYPHPLFDKLQSLPTDKPITTWRNREEAFKIITEQIDKLVTAVSQEREKLLAFGSFETMGFLGNIQEGLE